MFEIKILVDELDYDSLADVLVPLVARSMREHEGGGVLREVLAKNPDTATSLAHTVLSRMSPEKKEELVMQLVAKYRENILRAGRSALEKNGLKAQLCDISVHKIS